MHKEYSGTLRVQTSSSKILIFLVNDLLDFAQLRSGKFRKNLSQFSIKEAIHEVKMIQEEKAEFMGIELVSECEGFSEGRQEEFLICSDLQRFQQVLLNL